jgi:hypothetical protein
VDIAESVEQLRFGRFHSKHICISSRPTMAGKGGKHGTGVLLWLQASQPHRLHKSGASPRNENQLMPKEGKASKSYLKGPAARLSLVA